MQENLPATPKTQASAQAQITAAMPRSFGLTKVMAIAAIFVIVAYVSTLVLPFVVAIILLGVGMGLLSLLVMRMLRNSEQRIRQAYAAMTAAEAARQQAEAATREKSRILSTMSHEIRTPLNGVVGMLGLLSETRLTQEQHNYVNTAQASSRTLLSIIDEILNTAKSEKVSRGQHEAVDLMVLVESITELLSPRAHAKGLEISAHVAAGLPHEIKSDELRLRQILFNLTGNAIKFTEKGYVAITVSQPKPQWLRFCVSDTGIGMSEEEVQRLFREFSQANATTQSRFGGTGLGLSISKGLAQALGGDITVESKPGLGTRFSFEMPFEAIGEARLREQPLLNRHYVLALEKGMARDQLTHALNELGATVTLIKSRKTLASRLQAAKPFEQFICASPYFSTLRDWARKDAVAADVSPAVVWVFLKVGERKENIDLLHAPFAGYLLNPLRRSTLLSQLALHDNTALHRAGQLLRHASPSASARRRKEKSSGQKLNVLVAEDNAVNALLARTILEKLGHCVTLAQDGCAARDILKQNADFDLALIDIEMPRLGGLELARLIRSSDELHKVRHIPILALTGNVHPIEKQSCLAAGMDGHLAKPFDRLDLESKIHELGRF